MQPANWEFERFSLPPGFAPGITYKGAEELRFAPGMFKKIQQTILLMFSWLSWMMFPRFHKPISGIIF